MRYPIYYFTGTGNSLYLAGLLAEKTGADEVIPISKAIIEQIPQEIETVGIVCPNYAFNIPHIVKRFIEYLGKNTNVEYVYVVISAGGNNGNVSDKVKKDLKKFKKKAIFTLLMVTNYIQFANVPEQDIIKERLLEAQTKVDQIAEIVKSKKSHVDKKKDYYKVAIMPGLLYTFVWPGIPKMAKDFWTTDSCNSCEICLKICPVNNIKMKDGRPEWGDHCEQCLACMHWCPHQSIQHGKNTINRKRYHNPKIKLNDMIL